MFKLSILSIIILFNTIAFSVGLIAFDCSGDKSTVREVSLVDTEKCIRSEKNITTEEKSIQIIQPKIFDKIDYISCLVELDHLIYRCGKTFDNFHDAGIYTELYTLTRSDCQSMITNGYLKYNGVSIKFDSKYNVHHISLTTYGSISDGSCTPGDYGSGLVINGKSYERAVRLSNIKITMKKGQADIDIEDKVLIFPDGTKCNYKDNKCFSVDYGFIFWEPYISNILCRNVQEYIPIYDGIATEIKEYKNDGSLLTSYILHYQGYDFEIVTTGIETRICTQLVKLTEHPKLAVLVKNHFINDGLETLKNPLDKNINIMTYFNSKILYIAKHNQEQITDLYNYIKFEKCLSDNKILLNMMTLAILSPHNFAYQYFGKPGYTATITGEVINLIKCTPVYVNFTKTEKCYNEIPVLYYNKQYYITPKTRILTEIGTERECSLLLKNKFKFNNEWFLITKEGLFETKEPDVLTIAPTTSWKYNSLPNLAKSGIYSQEDLDKVQKEIMSPIRKDALTYNLQKGIIDSGNIDKEGNIISILSEKDFEKMAKRTFGSFLGDIYNWMSGIGNFISVLIAIVFFFKFFKFFLDSFINTTLLYKAFGFSWKLLFGIWENLTHHLLRTGENNSNIKTANNCKDDNKTTGSNDLELRELV